MDTTPVATGYPRTRLQVALRALTQLVLWPAIALLGLTALTGAAIVAAAWMAA